MNDRGGCIINSATKKQMHGSHNRIHLNTNNPGYEVPFAAYKDENDEMVLLTFLSSCARYKARTHMMREIMQIIMLVMLTTILHT